MKKLYTTGLVILFFLGAAAQEMQQKMDALVAAYVGNKKFNGTVLVAQKGNILYDKGYGYSNAENKVLNSPASIFQIGSITKQFTAAIIMQLQQEKKLSLQDKLSKYFKGFANGDKITIEHLLTHTSGLYNYTEDSTVMNGDVTKHYSRDELISLFLKYPSDFEPGSKWNYSNTGYLMLGYIIEKVTGKPYEKVVRERILQPLNMSHSGFDFTNLKSTDKTKGYFDLSGSEVKPAPIVDSTIAYSAGALYTTTSDLYKWDRAIYSDKILKPESWKQVFTPYKSKYGYGWGIDSLYGQPIVSHSGGIHGYSSYILRFPQEELVVIVFDNSSSGSLNPMAKSLAAIVLNKPYVQPEIKTVIAVDAATLKNYQGEYELAPGFILTVTAEGNQLKAQATGQQITDLFPEKPNVFFLKVVEAKIEFILDEKGVAKSLILYQNGREIPGKKIK
jgi:CubicO group peptidase (beta-lactamase class C family)